MKLRRKIRRGSLVVAFSPLPLVALSFAVRATAEPVTLSPAPPAAATLMRAAAQPRSTAPSAPSQAADQTAPGDYVGTDTCATCHDAEAQSYRRSVHAQTESGDFPAHGCESCHGPGRRHVEGGGDPQFIFSFTSTKNTVEQKVDRCLTCHNRRERDSDFRMSGHMKGTVDCSSCHKPHQGAARPRLLVRPGFEACIACHPEVVTQTSLNEHHRIPEGVVQCSDCHDPHGRPQLRSDLGGFKQVVCVRCHTDEQGPFIFEHGSVLVEGCTACHSTPHGSVNRHMLAYQRTAELCFSCHTNVPSFHVRFNADTNCTNCHSSIHGSNLSPFFLK